MASKNKLPVPPIMKTASGDKRRIGVELEFIGLSIETIDKVVKSTLGGEVEPLSPYMHKVRGTSLGDLGVELDYGYLKQAGLEEKTPGDLKSEVKQLSEDLIAAFAKRLVPFEIVTPPIPMDRLGELRPLVKALREAGALGTHKSPVYAFGMHLNPEMPDLEPATVVRYLRAYFCLAAWLRLRADVAFTRRISPYIDAFDDDYVRKVIDPDYEPDAAQLIDDYVKDNPSRNRALDLLPVLCEIDEARVRKVVDDERVNARPALHYRLPNCDIDNPTWNIDAAWIEWLQVEHLVTDEDRLADLCEAYGKHLGKPLDKLVKNWSRECQKWLIDPADL